MRDASDILIKDLKLVTKILKKQAYEYKDTPMIGRTHGIHAEPKTLGLVFALWYDEMKRNTERMKRAREVIGVGKISGAVGTYANVPPEIEEDACRRLGLKAAAISTQIVQRDIHAEFFVTLSIIASGVEKIATEIRHFQRTEVLELEEPFTQGQKGSSAMPHKRNPVLSENLSGLARLVRSYALPALENIPLWHERDISHSSVERVIGPDGTILLDFMLSRACGAPRRPAGLSREHEEESLDDTRAHILPEGPFKAGRKGILQGGRLQLVQENAMRTWKGEGDFRDLLAADKAVTAALKPRELDECFDESADLKHVDRIFERVFS